MNNEILEKAIAAIIELHKGDPLTETVKDETIPSELLYARRMAAMMTVYEPHAAPTLVLAAWCHHIRRWEVARELYPMDRPGYYQWRRHVMQHQLSVTTAVLQQSGAIASDIEAVTAAMQKDNRRDIHEAQILEDVACMVFVKYYLEAFAQKHDPDKVTDIIRKTMLKVSERGQNYISKLPLNDHIASLLNSIN